MRRSKAARRDEGSAVQEQTSVSSSDKFLVEDLLEDRLLVVFCGTALGNRSAVKKEYYAHRSNKFWEILHEVGLTRDEMPLPSKAYRRVREFGIGLTDLCKSYHGNDDQLPKGALDRMALQEKMEAHRPAILAFTSKTAGKAWAGYKSSLDGSRHLTRRRKFTYCHLHLFARDAVGWRTSIIGRYLQKLLRAFPKNSHFGRYFP
jgi:G:T/U-mismatch repair DNA glycosylase